MAQSPWMMQCTCGCGGDIPKGVLDKVVNIETNYAHYILQPELNGWVPSTLVWYVPRRAELPKEDQEETNAKWRPWFDSLTDNEKCIIVKSALYSTHAKFDTEGNKISFRGFPEAPDSTWEMWRSSLNRPENWVALLVEEIPALGRQISREEWEAIRPTRCTCGSWGGPLHRAIVHLNDVHHFTYEQVADWLDTLNLDLTFRSPYDDVENNPNSTKE